MSAGMPVDELYREVVLDHHRDPRGHAPLERVDAEAAGKNPSCGDEVTLRLSLEGGRVVGVQVESHGCAISTASGSMLAEQLEGLSLEGARALTARFRAALLDHGEAAELGDLEALLGVRSFPMRVKCALLPWITLVDALDHEEAF
jgi:nitrogen fixation NifU-like protein